MMNNRNFNAIKVMSVKEACDKLDGFLKKSIKIDPLPFGNEFPNELIISPDQTDNGYLRSLSDDYRNKLLQVPTSLREIETRQSILKDKSASDFDADPLLSDLKNECDRLSSDLHKALMVLIHSQEIINVNHPNTGQRLDDLLFEITLTLANLNPINSIDFATQDSISAENKIVTSDRYQYDIDSLQVWLRHNKTNPWTNLKFSNRDIDFIRLNLQVRKPYDAIDINEGNPFPGGDPNLDATIELSRILEAPVPMPTDSDFRSPSTPTQIGPYAVMQPSDIQSFREMRYDIPATSRYFMAPPLRRVEYDTNGAAEIHGATQREVPRWSLFRRQSNRSIDQMIAELEQLPRKSNFG